MVQVLHLVDDVTPGGVMRVVDHLSNGSRGQASSLTHKVARVSRKTLLPDRKEQLEGADILVSHLSLNWRSFIARTRLRAGHASLPMLHVEHSYTQGYTAQNVKQRRRFYAMLRTGFGLFDHVVAVSDAQRNWMLNRHLLSADKVTTIRSAVDLAPFAAMAPPKGPIRRFGLIGRLVPCKGFDIAIEAFRRCAAPDLRLDLYGNGPDRTRLAALADGDPRIRFHGYVPDPTMAMQSVDAVLMPSRWEAYGLVAQEARAAGRPVVAANVDGLRDQEADGVVLVPGHEVKIWSRMISELADSETVIGRVHGTSAFDPRRASSVFTQGWHDLLIDRFSHA